MRALLMSICLTIITLTGFSQVWVYDCPDGDIYKSPDYEVRLINGADTLENFVYYSSGKTFHVSVGGYYPGVYLVIVNDSKGNMKKLKIRK